MKTCPGSDPVLNLGVAFQALQSPRPSPEIVTRAAGHDTLQLQMRPGQRAGRDLGGDGFRAKTRGRYDSEKGPGFHSGLRN